MSRKAPFAWVDAFSSRPFSGNPAAVCTLETSLSDEHMQSLATEFGLSETAFVWPESSEVWRLRWFTPAAEVRLCGHATVAAATALWAQGIENNPLRFETLSGELKASRKDSLVELNFPARPPGQCEIPDGLLSAMGLAADEVLWCGRDADDYMLRLADQKAVEALSPDFGTLAKLKTRGVIFTAPGENHDFISRFFAPRVGVDEDPVTGSAHCCLTPYWSSELGKSVMKAAQLSARRGELEVELLEDRVALRGASFILVQGEVNLQ